MTVLKNTVVLLIGILLAILLAEAVSRLALPIFPGARLLNVDGSEFRAGGMTPGAVYRQFSQEYDAPTTIAPQGYRAPAPRGDPELVFIGDSFTFGVGLSDEQTIPYLACRELALSCVNLGVNGFSTEDAVNRLQIYLDAEQWRPKRVYLFMMAMTAFLGAGNDLYDNVIDARDRLRADGAASLPDKNRSHPDFDSSRPTGFVAHVLEARTLALRYSNLARVLKFYLGPAIKAIVSPWPSDELLEEALLATQIQLARLDRLAATHRFEYKVFLIHPVQDILRGSDGATVARIEAISPVPIRSTALLFEPSPADYYFPLDGHLNPAGSRRVADYVVSQFGRSEGNQAETK